MGFEPDKFESGGRAVNESSQVNEWNCSRAWSASKDFTGFPVTINSRQVLAWKRRPPLVISVTALPAWRGENLAGFCSSWTGKCWQVSCYCGIEYRFILAGWWLNACIIFQLPRGQLACSAMRAQRLAIVKMCYKCLQCTSALLTLRSSRDQSLDSNPGSYCSHLGC